MWRQPRWNPNRTGMPNQGLDAESFPRAFPGGQPGQAPQRDNPATWPREPVHSHNMVQDGRSAQGGQMTQADQFQQYDGLPTYDVSHPGAPQQAQGFQQAPRPGQGPGFRQAQRSQQGSGISLGPDSPQNPGFAQAGNPWDPGPVFTPETLPRAMPSQLRDAEAYHRRGLREYEAEVKALGKYNKWYFGQLSRVKEDQGFLDHGRRRRR